MNELQCKEKGKQQGFFLIELVVSMMTMAFLLAGVVSCFFVMMKMHQEVAGTLFLQEQVRFAAAGLVRDLTYAHDVDIGNAKITIFTNRKGDKEEKIVYELKSGKIMKDNQPVTGDNQVKLIQVQKFSCLKLNERTVLINIQATHLSFNKVFDVDTAAVLLNHRQAL